MPAGRFFLFGPHGTGQSTWLLQRFPTAMRIDRLALDVLHSLVEERPELRFVLTGSSARKLRHGGGGGNPA